MKIFLAKALLLFTFIFGIKDISRKIISDDHFNYVFYVTENNKSNFDLEKQYYWFKAGKIHSSYGGANSQILHGEFRKNYRKNGLAEYGLFHNGLKKGIWKTWYENGKIETIQDWNNGFAQGDYKEFSDDGTLLISGRYSKNKKDGIWINHSSKDTVEFKKGKKVVENIQEDTSSDNSEVTNEENISFWIKIKNFFKNTFRKKTEEEKNRIEKEKQAKKKQKELDRKRKELKKKGNSSQKGDKKL